MIGNIMNIFYCHFYINLIYSFMKKKVVYFLCWKLFSC